MDKQITIKYSYQMANRWIDILYIEYSGGGESWEFRVSSRNNFDGALTELHTSENGYGNPASAASDGFKWSADADKSAIANTPETSTWEGEGGS
jgi:hypothetical protein